MQKVAKTFVLIHGSWLGGWSWRRVEPLLRARGHRVFAPTLTGVGDRSHLISRSITLDTWVRDVEQLFEFEELNDVIMVGHSFGGRVVTGFADRRTDLIERIVFLDSVLPVSGQSLLDQLPEAARAARVATSVSSGGISIPPPTALALGVMDPEDQEWVDRRMSPQPFGTNAAPLTFANPIGNGRPVSFVEFTEPVFPASELAVRFARQQVGWDIHTIATGHMAMVSEPHALADLLCAIAETPLKDSR